MFPYLSGWILTYGSLAFVVNAVVPVPYGKFSKSYMPLQIDPRIAWFMQHGLVLTFLVLGWFEDNNFRFETPQTNKGWTALTFLWVHFLWRGIISQVIFERRGSKRTSILLPLIGLLYYIPVGMNFRRMCYEIDEEIEAIDFLPLLISMLCLLVSAAIEIMYAVWRSTKENCYIFDDSTMEYYGPYVRTDFLEERIFLFRYGNHTPNYLLEVLEWLFFALFVFRWEAFWFFVVTMLILWARGAWTVHWNEEVEKLWK